MSRIILVIATLALILSIVAVLAPKEVSIEKPIVIELPIPAVQSDAEDNTVIINPTHRLQPSTTYHWVESDSYRQWKNSVKTEDKYLPSHFGLGGSLSSSGYWERR